MERGYGFIHDNIDIKILMLFILDKLSSPVDLETLSELTMCDGGVNYFDFSQCLAELIDTEHVEEEIGGYVITEKGRRNGRITQEAIPYSVRLQAEKNASRMDHNLKRNALIHASHTRRSRGGCQVTLSLSDGVSDLFTLELFAGNEEQAAAMEENFRSKAEDLYGTIIETLCD